MCFRLSSYNAVSKRAVEENNSIQNLRKILVMDVGYDYLTRLSLWTCSTVIFPTIAAQIWYLIPHRILREGTLYVLADMT
jgi:hypothetical protein